MGPELPHARGRGSAALGWASVSWEKAAELDCELRPSWA